MTASVGTKTGAESVIQNSAKMINKDIAIIWKIRALLPHPSNPRNCVSCICRSQLPPNFWKVSQSSIFLLKYLSWPFGCLAGPSSSTRRIVDWETTTNSSNYKEMLQYQMCNYCTAFSYHLTYFFSKFMLIKYWDIYLNKTKIIQIELLLIIIKCNVYSVVVNSKGQSALAKYEWILLKAQWAKSQVIQDLM